MTKSTLKYFSKNNPRPKPTSYHVDPNRKTFPPSLFTKAHQPRPSAMEDFRNRYYRYPKGVTPIFENTNKRKEEK
jgi:hypothetical protein